MGKPGGKAKGGKKGARKGPADESAKMLRASKRREKRQSRAAGSKRRERQNKRKGEGQDVKGKGKGKGNAHSLYSVVITPKNPLKQQFNKMAENLVRARQPAAAAAPGTPEAFFERLLQHVSPMGYFSELGLQGPSGQFVTVAETLEVVAKMEQKKKAGGKKDAKAVGADVEKSAEDKPSEQAITRAKKLLEERAATLPIFDLLGDATADKRAEGVKRVLALLKKPLEDAKFKDDATVKQVDKAIGSIPAYVLGRLVKGLSSGVGGARLGHALAIAKILKETTLPIEYVNSQVETHLSVQGGAAMMGEQKQMAWGALFATAAAVASGRTLERVNVMVMTERLSGLHTHLYSARESIAFMFAELIDTLEPAYVEKVVLPRIVDTYRLTEAVTRWSAEGLFLFLRLFTLSRPIKVPEAISEAFATRSPAHPDNAAKLADSLFHGKTPAVFAHYPRVHIVWDAWLHYLKVGSTHDKKSLQSTEKRLRSFWEALVAPKLLGPDGWARNTLRHVLPRMVQVILSAPATAAGIPHRISFLAEIGKAYPAITTELLKWCSKGIMAPEGGVKDPKEAAAGLVKQLFELNSDSLRQQLKDMGDAAEKPKKKKDEDDSSDDEDEGEDDEESQAALEEDEEMDAESVEEEDREGYQRFAFNMRKLVMAEMRQLALGDRILADHPGAFQTVLTFFATHAFFSVPEGAVDSDGLMSMDTFPLQLRNEAKDHFFTLIRHVSTHASGMRDECAALRRNASPIFVSVVKLYQRLATNAGCEAVYGSTPATAPILKKISKVLTTGAGKCSKAGKEHELIETHHTPHFEALLLLLFFSVVLEGEVMEANPELLEGVVDAIDVVGKAFTSGQFVARDLLDALMTVNLRAQEEATAHLGALVSKISLDIFEFVVADRLRTQEDIAVLIAPLSDERFGIAEDGVGGDEDMPADDEEEDDDDDDEKDDQATAGKKPKQSKADRELLEKQLAHARARTLQYINMYLTKVKSVSPWVGLIAVPIARLAELSLPKVSASRNKKREGTAWNSKDRSTLQNTSPVLSQCLQTLQLIQKAPPRRVDFFTSGDDAAKESVAEALAFLSAIYCKEKEKMFEREGQQLRAAVLRCVLTLNAQMMWLDPKVSTEKHFAAILANHTLSAQFTEAVVIMMERCGESLAHGILPALVGALSKDAGRPFHRKVLFEVANGIASKWTHLTRLHAEAKDVHASVVASLLACAKAFKADEALGEDSWRHRVVVPAAINLQVTLVRYLKKIEDAGLKKFTAACQKVTVKIANDAEVLDLDTKSALRKAYKYMEPEVDYQAVVQGKPHKPPQTKKAAKEPTADELAAREEKKRQREEQTAKAAAAEEAAASQKHAEKKKKAEERAQEKAGKKKRPRDEAFPMDDDMELGDEPAQKPAKKAKKEKKEKKDKPAKGEDKPAKGEDKPAAGSPAAAPAKKAKKDKKGKKQE